MLGGVEKMPQLGTLERRDHLGLPRLEIGAVQLFIGGKKGEGNHGGVGGRRRERHESFCEDRG